MYKLMITIPLLMAVILSACAGAPQPSEGTLPTPSPSPVTSAKGQYLIQWERSGGIAGLCYQLTVAMDGHYQLTSCQPGGLSQEGVLPDEEIKYLSGLADQYRSFQWKVPALNTGPDMFMDQYTFNGQGSQMPSESDQQALNEHLASLVQTLLGQKPPESSGSGSGIQGLVTIGPVCPGPVKEGDTLCADQPYQAWISILAAGGKVVQRIQSDLQGHFSISLPPGTYTLHPESTGVLPMAGDQTVSVTSGQVVQVAILYDSGIR